MEELQVGLAEIGASPKDSGRLEMIVCRPKIGERRVIEQAVLDPVEGLVGDNWRARGSKYTEDGNAHPDMQLTLMNSRTIQILAGNRSRWPLAGDQLYVDLDLSVKNLRPGQRLTAGTAVLEITNYPHTGCAQFTEHYGHNAIRLVNSKEGQRLRRRGIYARVIQRGAINAGDVVSKIEMAI